MNTITIEVEIEDEKLRNTLYRTIDVEMEATKTERGEADAELDGDVLRISISAKDYVAARAITNSVMRLLQTSADVAERITIKKSKD